MSLFSPTVDAFWHSTFLDGEVLFRNADLTVVANAKLEADRRAMVLQGADANVCVALTPALAGELGLAHQQDLTEPLLRQMLHAGNIQLHGADYVFYFTEVDKHALMQEPLQRSVRQLHGSDADMFAEFQSSASEQDLDDAYVELDHWAVFGAFENERLVCAASMYPWDSQKIADVGVLTLPPHRGMGHASRVIRAISRYACDQGYEPQYRCQLDNSASVSLAKAAGLTRFGTLEFISPES
jgi:RimJ/RimL family protein N-acetyltransferase